MISIIIPVYRVEPYIHQCIKSIVNQTYREIEILLINDGSPDKCGEICEEYAKKDKRIRVFHTENKGISAARNLGLDNAKGDYIGFVDADDWIEREMYEVLLRRLEETGTDICACAIRREFLKGHMDYSIHDAVYLGTEANRALVYGTISNGVWNKIYKKACWANERFPENRTYEEIATIHKVILKARSLSCMPEPLYHYRMRDGSVVHTPSMDNRINFWTASYSRYLFYRKLPEFENDQSLIMELKNRIAIATARLWLCMYRCPRKQHDCLFLHKVSFFVRKNYPLFGNKGWKYYLRIAIFFSRNANDISFAILYALNYCHSFFKKKKRVLNYP